MAWLLVFMATLTHVMGMASGQTSASYRARADGAAVMKIEYSTASDLSGSTLSSGVSVVSGDDFTGGETISGLSAHTRYYYSIVLDGVRQEAAPFPSWKTLPSTWPVKVCFISCQTDPDDPIFAAIHAHAPDLIVHLGDRHYGDTTVLATSRTEYKTMYAPGSDFVDELVRRYPFLCVWDDHDYGGNNEDGDLANKANSLQAFKEYTPTMGYAHATGGVWQRLTIGTMVDLFALDTRYQREGSMPRIPGSGSGTTVSGTTGTTLVVADGIDAGQNKHFDDYLTNRFVEVDVDGTIHVAFVTDSTYHAGTDTHICTIDTAIPGLESGQSVVFKQASMLDMDTIANGQRDWVIDGLTSSPCRWPILASSVIWNLTATGASDVWPGYDPERMEQRYIQERIGDVPNVHVWSGDRHGSGIDDGTNGIQPEATSSPANNDNIDPLVGTWSHGENVGPSLHMFGIGLYESTQATLSIYGPSGLASGITPLTLTAEGVDLRRVPWLRA